MTKDDLGVGSADDRRAQAEKRLAVTRGDLQSLPREDVHMLVHELQVHQIELEMQNEELRRAREEIEAASAKYSDLYNFAPVGYFILDRRGLILEANLTGARLLEMERTQLIGTPFFLRVAPEDRKLFSAHLQKVFTSRVNQSCELKLAPREGVSIHLALESLAVDDHEGDKPQCRTAVMDISEKKRAEQETARLASFPQLDPNPILEVDLTGAITFYNEAALKKVRQLGLEDSRSLLPGDLDETFQPIMQQGEKAFCLEIKKADVVFVVQAHYTPQFQAVRFHYTDVTQRKRAETTLKESESRSRAIFEQTAVGVAEIETATGRFIRVNNKFCEIAGLSSEELTATSFMSITLPEDLKVDLQYLQKLQNGQIRNFSREKRYRRQDGSVVWVNLTVSPMWKVGEAPSYHIALVEDITTRKAAEKNLRLEMLFSDMAIESLPGLFYLFDNQENLRRWNRNFEGVSGYPAAELAWMKPQDFFLGQEKLQVQAAVQEVFLKGESSVEADFISRDGRQTPYFFTGKRFVIGEQSYLLGMGIDITARVKAERNLRQARREWEEIFQAIGHPTIILDAQHRIIMANRATQAAAGGSASDLQGKKCYEIFHHSDQPPESCPLEKMLISGYLETVEMEIEALGGVYLVSCTPVVDEAGRLQKVIHIATDITERKKAEEALKESETTLKSIFKAAPIGIGLVQNRRFVWINEQLSNLTGYSADELRGQSARLLYASEEEFARVGQVKYDEIRESGTGTVETRFKCKDGSVKDILLSSTPLDPAQPTEAVIFTALDITERRLAREELYREKEKYRILTEESPLGVAIIDPDGRYQYLNPKFTEIFGYTLADIPTGKDWFAKAYEDELYRRQVMSIWMDDLSKSRVGEFRPRTLPVICKNGQEKIVHIRSVTLANQDQLIIYEDITERTRFEETLKSLIANAPMGIYIVQDGKFVLVNPGFEAITGYSGQELLGQDSLTLVTPEYKAFVRTKAINGIKKADTSPYEYQFTSKSGETGWVMETVISTQYEGKRAVLGYFMDITDHKKLENQFLQAQRMEAVGRLAGGLAHDFNNVLAIIVIYVETILKDIHPGDPLSLQVKGIREASLRAISLTRQLMAVGRRQILQPRAVNMKALVLDLEGMLSRLLGEDVELVLTLDSVESVAKVDPSQMEQVLLNLVVNARDAMPQGGKLTITINNTWLDKSMASQHADVTPGPYVMLAVSDTGIGMDQETQAHVLEPFYTTKPSAEGTGLGLSTVYGIVKQSGGFVEIDSERDKGAIFKIFLPAASETLEPPVKITESPLQRGSETILLVEDVDDLRQLIYDVLKNNGYTVLTASHGREALMIAEAHQGPIHLLLLDVVLPQMSGGEIAERLKSWFPGTKVLYMSGYPEDAIIHRKVMDGAAGFIQKPFSPINLASKVREVLHSSPQG
jgi:two-component system, cell cycle sensor histidine kinase and response regulator CckA